MKHNSRIRGPQGLCWYLLWHYLPLPHLLYQITKWCPRLYVHIRTYVYLIMIIFLEMALLNSEFYFKIKKTHSPNQISGSWYWVFVGIGWNYFILKTQDSKPKTTFIWLPLQFPFYYMCKTNPLRWFVSLRSTRIPYPRRRSWLDFFNLKIFFLRPTPNKKKQRST